MKRKLSVDVINYNSTLINAFNELWKIIDSYNQTDVLIPLKTFSPNK